MTGRERVLRIGLVGCGAIGRVHARNLPPHAELVFCNRTHARATEFCEEFGGVGVCDSFDELLAMEEIEGIVIATPPELHKQQVVQALKAGKVVMVEKPMCITPGEVDEIRTTLRQRPEAVLMVAENYYYKPSLDLMKEVIAWDGIGAVQHMAVKKLTRQKSEGWKSAHGALLEGGIHFIALISDLADTALAYAEGRPEGDGEDTSDLDLHAAGTVTAEFPTLAASGPERHSRLHLEWKGLKADLHYAWDQRSLLKGVFQHSVIEGSSGRITFESNGIYVRVKGPGRRGLTFPGFRDLMGYGAMTRDFLACVEAGGEREPYSNFDRASRDLGIAFAAYEQLQ